MLSSYTEKTKYDENPRKDFDVVGNILHSKDRYMKKYIILVYNKHYELRLFYEKNV